MNAKLVAGKIEIDVYELLDSFSDEERQKIVEHLSCFEEIIAHVGAQIIDGWTENGFWGAKGCGPAPYTALDKMRRKVAESAGDIAKQHIQLLQDMVERAEKAKNEEWQKNRRLERRIWDLESQLRNARGDYV